MYIPIDFAWLEATMLAAVRITAFIMIAPPFSYGAIPARVKATLAIGLSLAVGSAVAPGYENFDTGPFFGALVLQLVTGALLGFLVYLCFAALQAAGSLIDTFGGFQLAQAFDPHSLVNGAQFTRLFHLTALTLLFASGGYQLILAGLARSFDAVPVNGVFAVAGPAELLVDGVSQMMLAAVQIAGPLVLVLFLADVGLGLITRVAPALNAFAMGFPVKILLTLLLAGAVYAALPGIVDALASQALRMMQGVGP
ncbi:MULTISPECIES: flagellar biosynthetic protein FliR [unclassified Microbacterium]|uniref:flagellar biosynthetic protein FliR n=1 Tax=unclassified Microbacterium TaxID=2609290 RepID=UPI000EA9BAA1|nr:MULTISPECIES: flagellar biosynthetic protein FliR [unclassified Microbacterium]MBT2485027.1 flagellar biosynthetic protein FliR [Microbacterium sp. ISL-108]RKN67876.1 type III secretion protein [Microbacterium sp. CGR2]